MKRNSVIIMTIIIMILITACTSKEETAEQVVSNMLNEVKIINKENINKYFDYEKLTENSNDLIDNPELIDEQIKKILKELEYKIVSSEEGMDAAIVKTEITNINMDKIFREIVGNMLNFAMAESFKSESERMTEAEIEQKMLEIYDEFLEKHKDEKITNIIDIKLNKINNQWKIEIDESLQNAITGNLIKTIIEINSSFAS